MCDKHLDTEAETTKPAPTTLFGSRRCSIWDLPAHQCCPVIGTCLDVTELKRIKNRFQKHIQGVKLETDYDLHSYFVSVSSNKNMISAHINKTLNNQYKRFISTIKTKKTDEEIEHIWRQIKPTDLRSFAGYFWAIVSSKYASEQLKDRVYGEIHMISHIAGQSNKTATQTLLDDKQRAQQDMAKKDRAIDSKNQQLENQRIQINELRQRNAQITLELSGLKVKKKSPGLSAADYQNQLAEQQQNIYRLQKRIKQLEQQPVPAIQKLQRIDVTPIRKPEQVVTESCDGNCEDCTDTDLCGKKILYVGGFSRHRKKFQQLTHAINGEFYYHDGGKQQSEHQLSEMVKKADCIFCPVDCISHSAVGRIKSLAKSHCKDCIFLRSASLSSFDKGIRAYAN